MVRIGGFNLFYLPNSNIAPFSRNKTSDFQNYTGINSYSFVIIGIIYTPKALDLYGFLQNLYAWKRLHGKISVAPVLVKNLIIAVITDTYKP
jgi:hypothetical protein